MEANCFTLADDRIGMNKIVLIFTGLIVSSCMFGQDMKSKIIEKEKPMVAEQKVFKTEEERKKTLTFCVKKELNAPLPENITKPTTKEFIPVPRAMQSCSLPI